MCLRNRGKQQKAQIDIYLNQIVTQMQQQQVQLDWKQISSILLRNYKIELNFKSCYNRWKNYINKAIDTKFKPTREQKEKIFQLHCQGVNNMEIREKMNLKNVSDNTIKNAWKTPLQAAGRTLKTIYETNFNIQKIPKEFLKNQHFRIFLILFSSFQLLHYYLKEGKCIVSFQKLTKRYQQLLDEDINLLMGLQKKKNHQQTLQALQKNIKSDLQIIYKMYLKNYKDSLLKKKYIKNRDKLLDYKFMYLEAIMCATPDKIIKDRQINTKHSLNEQSCSIRKNIDQSSQVGHGQLDQYYNEINKDHDLSNVLFAVDESQIGLKFGDDIIEDERRQHMLFFRHTYSIQTGFCSSCEIEEEMS